MPGRLVRRISVVEGDITEQNVDAIVNAANRTLLGGGGVDGAIHRAAGPELLDECRTLGGCDTGEAKITRGYRLPARFIIHTVGPVWRGGQHGEDELLASCYREALALAESHDLKTIAFPAISTGAYGFPLPRATVIAVRTVLDYLSRSPEIDRVVFVCHGDRAFNLYHDAVMELAPEYAGEEPPDSSASEEPGSADQADDLKEQVRAQLHIIESVHGVRMVNREKLVGEISRHARDRRSVSLITAAINTWIAVNGITGETEIPGDELDRILTRIRD
ncbi:MAG: O-acetyl-ADP-ribose deacetylase [Methanomicrobiales archaeon]|nr:O-acetyl-ADP-ribose deacetylase [Methanomicrobiales archaeon]TRO42573.1 O-acetyl-ADP-ribose deacetylase [Candidatus Bathyarchaeota archaeon]